MWAKNCTPVFTVRHYLVIEASGWPFGRCMLGVCSVVSAVLGKLTEVLRTKDELEEMPRSPHNFYSIL